MDLILIDQSERFGDRLGAQRLQRLIGGTDDVLDESSLAVSDIHTVTIRQTRHGQARCTLGVACSTIAL